MITFKHKSNTKQIKIKSKRDLNQRMSPWLQGIFGIKNPIVGFRVANNKYYDTETFYNNKERFYGQVIDIIEAKDQLEISFVSDNLNSSSNVRNGANPILGDDFQQQIEDVFKTVNDTKTMERRLQDNKELNILFHINQIYKNEVVESMNLIKSQPNNKVNFYLRILQNKSQEIPCYGIYIGKKLIATLNLTRQYRQNILMVIERYSQKIQKNQNDRNQRHEEKDLQFRMSYDQENQAPSFTTYQLQQRLNQQACQDYLFRMYHQRVLKKYEYLKLNEKCEENFAQFYRIFCEGAMQKYILLSDNDYQNFKNEIRAKVDNNLQILLSNVDQMDLSRPISREEQRKQNLKKSVSNIQIVKVENYFQILDQLKHLLMPMTISLVKSQLLDQNQTVFNGFSDYLSRKITKEDLANLLQKAVEQKQKRPISRCIPRSANRNKEPAYYSEDEIIAIIPNSTSKQNQNLPQDRNANKNIASSQINVLKRQSFSNKQESTPKQEAQQIKLMSLGSGGSGSKQNNRLEAKQIPPMFGSSKQENNFSPIKYMSDIESNYKQAWTRLESKTDYFEPEQYGLLYYYLQSRDDSISNHIQELEYNQQSSLQKLKQFLQGRMIQILEQNFAPHELDTIMMNRKSQKIKCIYQNFRYESDLAKFLQSIREQIQLIQSASASPSPTLSIQPYSTKAQVLHKKSSDSNLLAKHKKSVRKYSDQQKEIHSPRQSSFSHGKSNQASGVYLQNMNSFWGEQFQQMLDHCNFTEEHKQVYLREAFRQGNPSVYAWINNFVQGKLGIIDINELKNSLKIRDQENRYVMKVVPIFSQILRSFQEEGQISDKMRKWCVVQLMQLNMSIVGSFQCYIRTKNSHEFVDNITIAFELQNNQMQYFRGYLSRIQYLLKQMSANDEVGLQIFKLYPKQIKSICQLYFITGDIDELLDNLDCIHQVQTKRRKFKIATLNFSGINLNPFEYYDGTQDTQKISDYMKEVLDTEKEALDDKFMSIDKPYQNNFMSIRFGNKVCESQYLLDRKQFAKRWRQYFNKEKPQSIKQASQQAIESMMLFDYYCYLSVVKHIYGLNWKVSDYTGGEFHRIKKNYQIQDIQKIESKKLKEYLQRKFARPSSKLQNKYQMTMDYFLKNDLDIFFLQEAGQIKWEDQLIHQFGHIKGGSSVIIFRKDKFGNPRTTLHEKYKNKLNFNNDTAFYFGDRGYLLLSIHLRSNPQVNIAQAQQMFKQLEQIVDQYPMIKIIIGMDANFFIGGSQHNFLNFVPKAKQQFTTNKMRTYLQSQFNKSHVLSKAGKDYILTNLVVKSYRIQKINGELAKQTDMLPSYDHPYDHFVVLATI